MTKTALLVTTFGSSYPDTVEKNILTLEKALAQSFPDYRFYRAYTSVTIRKILWERDHIKVDSVQEALDQILSDGCNRILVQPSFLVSGLEFHRLKLALDAYRERFDWIKLGLPLLSPEADLTGILTALKPDLDKSSEDVALLYMGHGTQLANDHVYQDLTNTFRQAGYKNAYIGTVEGKYGLDHVIPMLREKNYTEIHLLPLMLVAGDHARNDMIGDEPDSWRNVLTQQGWQVSYKLRGLGELPAIREIFVQRAKAAEDFPLK
ncbi:MAG: sirohydrochlorin cobaltochelatase [Eubacteriales bacterium]|nr:sirohydrochlorin cobaltochelatase [Eubacteriales bacterium]